MFRVVAFARAFPERPSSGLTWSHYADLLSVKSGPARDWYEAEAVREGWSRRQLLKEIQRGAFALEQDAQERGGEGPRGAVVKLVRPTKFAYVYGAEVKRVIDGDTLVVEIDLGFDVIRRQKMRLAEVDCAEAGTSEGRRALRFVREQLLTAEAVAVKSVKAEDVHGRYVGHVFYANTAASTEQVFRGGRHLNAELVTAGLARVL